MGTSVFAAAEGVDNSGFHGLETQNPRQVSGLGRAIVSRDYVILIIPDYDRNREI